MGLRERASDYSKAIETSRGVDLSLELKPDLNRPKNNSTPINAEPVAAQSNISLSPKTPGDFVPNDALGTKSRLDSILNLVEIYKEFGQVRSAKDLWQVVSYALMAQLGTKHIAIFMEEDARMVLKTALGFTIAEDFSFAASGKLAKIIKDEKKSQWIDDIFSTLSDHEQKFLTGMGARYASPVFRYEELRGVILVNPPAGKSQLQSEDLFYLKICGELLGAMESQLMLVAGAEAKTEDSRRAEVYRTYARDFVAHLGKLDNNEPLKPVLDAEFSRHFPKTAMLLMTREDFFLRQHFYTGFSRDKVEHLEVNLVDTIIERAKNGQASFAPGDFSESESFGFLAKYKTIQAHKVLHRQEFLALAFVASDDLLESATIFQMIDQYVLQNHISKLRDHATSYLNHADNPVVAIKNFITACEENLTKADEPYAVVVTDIMNYSRLHNLQGDAYGANVRDFTRKTLREVMEAQDFSTEVFHGHFVSVLRQKEAGDAWRISRMLQKQAGKAYSDEDSRPIFQHKIYARPHIQAIPFELLFKA